MRQLQTRSTDLLEEEIVPRFYERDRRRYTGEVGSSDERSDLLHGGSLLRQKNVERVL